MPVLTFPHDDESTPPNPPPEFGVGGGGGGGLRIPQPREARTIRDWRLDRKLGTGSTAFVYAATHVKDGRRAALKVLRAHADDATVRRFQREGFVANAVGHPGVVRVFDQGLTEDGALFIVMELLDGESLEAVRTRRGGSLPIAEVVDIGSEILEMLAAAHARRIIHRDLKPANIFVTKSDGLKLLDFGLAYIADPDRTSSITRTGTMMGTPAFMPPEQARGKRHEVDLRADIWALGATMFTLIAGRAVHVASSHPGQMLALLTKPAPALASVAPHVPAEVAAVIDRALAFDREQRWEDAAAMAEALRRVRRVAGLASEPPPEHTRVVAAPGGHLTEFDSTPVARNAADLAKEDPGDDDPSGEVTRVAPYALAGLGLPKLDEPTLPPEGEVVEHTLVQPHPSFVPRETPRNTAPIPPPPSAPTPSSARATGEARPPLVVAFSSIWRHNAVAGVIAGLVAGGLALSVFVTVGRHRHKSPTSSPASIAASVAPPVAAAPSVVEPDPAPAPAPTIEPVPALPTPDDPTSVSEKAEPSSAAPVPPPTPSVRPRPRPTSAPSEATPASDAPASASTTSAGPSDPPAPAAEPAPTAPRAEPKEPPADRPSEL